MEYPEMRKWLQRRLWALSYRLRDWSEWLDNRAWALTPPTPLALDSVTSQMMAETVRLFKERYAANFIKDLDLWGQPYKTGETLRIRLPNDHPVRD